MAGWRGRGHGYDVVQTRAKPSSSAKRDVPLSDERCVPGVDPLQPHDVQVLMDQDLNGERGELAPMYKTGCRAWT